VSILGDDRDRRRLAGELKLLRIRAGMSGRKLGALLDIEQGTVSKIETLRQKHIPGSLIARWCDATDAPAAKRGELLDLGERIQLGPQSWEEAGGGSADLNPQVAALEAKTALLLNFRPMTVPGLLQTEAYARRIISSGPKGAPEDLASWVANRTEGRRHVLTDPAKAFRFVITEAALRMPFGPAGDPVVLDEHAEQLARVRWATQQPNITVAVLPLAACPAWRQYGFVIFDEVAGGDPVVHIETISRPVEVTDEPGVSDHRTLFAGLLGACVTGGQARELIDAAASSLRPS
jgi:transcriptional regulator with XRE-family HTH domain